jgi:hypothetical protein
VVLIVKLLLGVAMALAAIPALRCVERAHMSARSFDLASFALLAASRLLLFLLIFVVFATPPNSDAVVYWDEANAVLAGDVPMASVPTAYGFLFDYIVAGVICVWNSPTAIVLFSLVVELTSFPVWLEVGRRGFSEKVVRRAAVLYVLNPLAVSTVVIAGQNHVWISVLLGLSLQQLTTGRAATSGFALGLSIVAVKFLGLLFAPILFLASRGRVRWLAAFLVLPVVGYAVPIVLGARPWDQVMFHALYESSGSIPYFLGAFGLDLSTADARLAADAAAFATLCAAFTLAVWRLGSLTFARAVLMCAFVLAVTLLAQEKSFTTYLVVTLFPVCLAIAMQSGRWAAIFMQAFSTLASLEPSLWFRWMHQNGLGVLLARTLAGDLDRAHVLAFAACEAALLAGYVALLVVLWRSMSALPGTAEPSSTAPNVTASARERVHVRGVAL